MKKILRLMNSTFALTLVTISVSACSVGQTRDITKIYISEFARDLQAVHLFNKNYASITTPFKLDETTFQNAIYQVLETKDLKFTSASNEIVFTYYNQSGKEEAFSKLKLDDVPVPSLDPNVKVPTVLYKIAANPKSSHFYGTTDKVRTSLYLSPLIDISKWKTELSYNIEVLKKLSVKQIFEYLDQKNPTVYFNEHHFKIVKEENKITVTALDTSDRYQKSFEITF